MIIQYFPINAEQILPLIFLYTEIHHRFKFFGSKYFKKEPEINADIPHRVEPAHDIPLLILIKDSHKFPVTLLKIDINISNRQENFTHKIEVNEDISELWWERTYYLDRPLLSGLVEINTSITYVVDDKMKTCTNHNLPIKNSLPLHTFLSDSPFPREEKIIYGDLHYHTNVTEDMVEFGAPLEPTYIASKALGLDFVCNTDHSYDIDDKIDSWSETDPELTKWNNSQEKIKQLNLDYGFRHFMIPSEELSLHNLDGYNIHALILNNEAFLPGQGDGAEKPFDFSCKFNTSTLANALEDKAICIAAHPCAPVPFAQKMFFKRGKWNFDDLAMNHISGLQFFNGEIDESFQDGLEMWKRLILSGYKKFIYAGNDAHGNFNKYRQIKIPMISIHEKDTQILGECRTGVILEKYSESKIESTVSSLKMGRCFITNGPLFYIEAYLEKQYQMGDTVQGNIIKLQINFSSTEELGNYGVIEVFKGVINDMAETLIEEIEIKGNQFSSTIEICARKNMYVRAEFSGNSYRGERIALTNPIWIKPS